MDDLESRAQNYLNTQLPVMPGEIKEIPAVMASFARLLLAEEMRYQSPTRPATGGGEVGGASSLRQCNASRDADHKIQAGREVRHEEAMNDNLKSRAAEYARERQSYGARVVIADFAREVLAEKERELAELKSLIASDKYDGSALVQMYLAQCESERNSPVFRASVARAEAAERESAELRAEVAQMTAEILRLREELDRISMLMCGKPWASRNMDLPVYIQNQCDGREIAEKALDAAEQELHDIKEWWPIIMAEKCPKDEVHCTCVPALRIIAKNAEAQLAQLQADNAALREKVAGLESRAEVSERYRKDMTELQLEYTTLTAKLAEALIEVEVVANIFKIMPKPTLGGWDWSRLEVRLRTLLAPAAPTKEPDTHTHGRFVRSVQGVIVCAECEQPMRGE